MSLCIHEIGGATLLQGTGDGDHFDLTPKLRERVDSALKEAERLYLSKEVDFKQLSSHILNFGSSSSKALDCPLPQHGNVQFILGTFVGTAMTSALLEDVSFPTHPLNHLFAAIDDIAGIFRKN